MTNILCINCLKFRHVKGDEGFCNLKELKVKTESYCNKFEKKLCDEPLGKVKVERPMADNIKPSHYKAGKFDVIAFCQEHDLSFDIGNIIKYCTRAGKKEGNSELQDLNKAMEYLKRRIEFVGGKE